MALVMNSSYHLRPDGNRALLYRYNPHELADPKLVFLHPLSAVIISLVDGTRDEKDLIHDTAFILDITMDAARNLFNHISADISSAIGEPIVITTEEVIKSSHVPRHVPRRTYKPQDFIVPLSAVNTQNRKLQFPLNINFIVTNRCSSRCVYCYAERDLSPITTHLPLQRVLELIDEAGQHAVTEITFSGGDALEWPNILPVVERTVQAGITPELSTKTYLSQRRCDELSAIGVDFMQYSLDAATAETADFMTGRKRFLEKATASIRHLVNAGIEVKLKAVVTTYNIAEVHALLALASDLGIRSVHLVSYGRSTFRHSDELFLDEAASRSLTEQLGLEQSRYPAIKISGFGLVAGVAPATESQKQSPSNTKPATSRDPWTQWKASKGVCSMGRTNLTILPDGSVLMCEQLPSEPRFIVGSVAQSSIHELWNSSEFTQRTLRPDRELFRDHVCYTCADFEWCHEVKGRCIRDAFKAYGDPYQADPRCPNAPPAPRLV